MRLVRTRATIRRLGDLPDGNERSHQRGRPHCASEPEPDDDGSRRRPEQDQYGLAINNAKDNASVWAIAQGQRADIGSLGAVKMSLDRATSIADVASTAGQTISDLLVQMKEKVVAAMDPSIDTASRTALDSDFKSILRQIGQVIQNANFDGANMLDGSVSQIKFIANADATGFITLSSQNLSLGGGIITVPGTANLSTITLATGVLTQLTTSISNTNQAPGQTSARRARKSATTRPSWGSSPTS